MLDTSLQRNLGAFLFLLPEVAPFSSPLGFHSLPLSTFAQSSANVTDLSTEKLSAFQNLIVDDFILTFYSPWGGLFITQ